MSTLARHRGDAQVHRRSGARDSEHRAGQQAWTPSVLRQGRCSRGPEWARRSDRLDVARCVDRPSLSRGGRRRRDYLQGLVAMSRVGLKPITMPDGVSIRQDGKTLHVSGPKGELTSPVPPGDQHGRRGRHGAFRARRRQQANARLPWLGTGAGRQRGARCP